MSENKHIIPEKIIIRSIKILGGSIFTENEHVPPDNIDTFNVQFGIKNDLGYTEKSFRFVLSINIDALDKVEKSIGIKANYSIEYIFFIENLEYYEISVDHDKKTVAYHPILANTLVSIVYSTSRGIILSRTQGTVLDAVVLPVIDTQQLLKILDKQDTFELATSH